MHTGNSSKPASANKRLTASQRAQQQGVQETAILTRRLIESQAVANIGSWETDLLTMEVVWTEQVHRIFETDPAAFRPTHAGFLELVHPDDRVMVNDAFMGSIDKTGACSLEHRIVLPDQRIRIVEERWRIFRDDSGKPLRALGTCQDITERKRAENEKDRLFRLSLDMLCIADFDGWLRQVNPAWTENLGWSAEELTGRPMIDFILPEDHDATNRVREKIYQGIAARGFENRYRCKDGTYRWLSWNVHPIPETRQVFAIARDITERKHDEEKLKEREDLLRSAQLIARMGSWIMDVPGGRLVWSDATCDLFGIKPAAFRGTFEHFYSFILPEDIPAFDAVQASVSPAAPLLEMEYRIRRPDGAVRWMYERGTIEFDAAGRQTRRLGMVMDVTEQRVARDLLRHHEDLLRMAGRLARLGGWSIDLPEMRLYWSDEVCLIHEVPAGTQPNVQDAIESYVPECRDMIRAAFENCVHEGTPYDLELELTTAKGRRIWVRTIGEAEYDASGRIIRVQGALQEITERKNMEMQFLRSQRFESIGTLAGGIAHDLNNVLAPIMISTEMLEMEIRDQGTLDVLKVIKTSAQRAIDLVKQVLTFSRGNEGQRYPVNVFEVVQELNRLVHDTFPKNIVTTVSSESGLWHVLAEPTQLHQVLLNLYVNSRDAMPDGGKITVRLENQVLDERYTNQSPDMKPGCYVTVAVTDNGQGIPPGIRDRIFDPFFTTKDVGKGTGLGLSTSLGIVRSYGGFINVYSESGRGTTIKLYIPALPIQETPQFSDVKHKNLPRGNGELILVVDDEAAVCKTVKRALEGFGYRVRSSGDGAEAIAIYSELAHEIAVVFTDMSMPVMDGPATIQALKNLNPEVIIVGASGLEANAQFTRAAGLNARYFISKPYSVETMLVTIAEAVAEFKTPHSG